MGGGEVMGDFNELPMLAQKHLGKDVSQPEKKSYRIGLLADGDSIGGTNSNPNIKGALLDPSARSIRDPRGSAAPGRIISKVVDGKKVMQVYQQAPPSRQLGLYSGNQTPAQGKLISGPVNGRRHKSIARNAMPSNLQIEQQNSMV